MTSKVDVAHGIGCLALTIRDLRPVATLSPDEAERLAITLIVQAAYARVLLAAGSSDQAEIA